MEIQVKVTVDLGERTVALLTGAEKQTCTKVEPAKVETPKAEPAKVETPKAQPAKVETPKAEPAETRTRRTKTDERIEGWDDMDDDAKLEAIKAEVTRHTKKGKSADIKQILAQFDAGRASELLPDDYDAFFDAIARYGKGEKLEEIFPESLE